MGSIERVLLIDDSKAVNNRNVAILEGMELFGEIHSATSASEALDYIKKNTTALPELIFLDLSMPEEDGFDFLEMYTDLIIGLNLEVIPLIVVVSDYLFENRNLDNTNKFKSVGVVNHIRKPMDSQDVLDILDEHFEE